MLSFPNVDTYVICYSVGTGGAFISSLIYELLLNPNNTIPIGKDGDAHERAKYYIKNWRIQRNDRDKVYPTYKNITPVDPNQPLIIQQHWLPKSKEDFDLLFQKYPKCKLIIISYSDKDINIINSNIKKKLTDIQSLKENIKIHEEYQDTKLQISVPHTLIRFNDIIQNPQQILETLTKVTNKQITTLVQESYREYLKKQDSLCNI